MAKALPVFAVNPQGTLAENAPLMLHTRMEELYRWSEDIFNPERIAELHNMRIAAKRLRYTLEIFAPCFPNKDYKWVTEQVKSIQEQIGEIHDADVRGPLFETYLTHHARRRPEIRVGLELLVRKEQEIRQTRYQSFLTFWSALQKQDFRGRFFKSLARVSPAAAEKELTDAPSG